MGLKSKLVSGKENATLFKRAFKTSRKAAKESNQGQIGEWDCTLKSHGFTEQEVNDILKRLEAHGIPVDPEKTDGNLRLNGTSYQTPLGTAIAIINNFFAETLQKIDVPINEFYDKSFELEMTPTETDLSDVKLGWLAKKLSAQHIGVSTAATETLDMQHRLDNDSHTYRATLLIQDIDQATTEKVMPLINEVHPTAQIKDGILVIEATLEQVGSPFGAIVLLTKNINSILNHINPQVRVNMLVSIVE